MIKNLKYLFLILAFISCAKDELSPEQSKSFIKFLGPNAANQCADIKVLSDGSYIILGSTTTANRGTDLLLIKTDKFGNEIWQRQFGGPKDDWGTSLQVLPSGDLLALGNTTDSVSLKTNILMVKTVADGNVLWQKRIVSNNNDIGNKLILSNNETCYIAGTSDSITTKSGLVVQLDFNGNVSKKRPFGAEKDEIGAMIERNDTLFFAGISSKLFVAGGKKVVVLYYILKKDVASIQNTNYGGRVNSTITDDKVLSVKELLTLHEKGFIILGNVNGVNADFFMLKAYPKNTKPEWVKTYDGGSNDIATSIIQNPDSTLMILGTKGISETNSNIWLLKTDILGNKIWDKTYGATGLQSGAAIAAVPDGGYILAGTNEYGSNTSISLIKIKDDGGL
jgi:hypothetical protein